MKSKMKSAAKKSIKPMKEDAEMKKMKSAKSKKTPAPSGKMDCY